MRRNRFLLRGVAALPDDALFEVFSRVRDVKSLFRCAATCRRWLRLFTDPDFLRRFWPQQDLLLGFFLKTREQEEEPIPTAPTFVPSPTSPMDGVPFSLVSDDTTSGYSAKYVASRCGIVLVRYVPTEFDEFKKRTRFLLVLCDPISRAHDVLPELECACHSTNKNAYAILTAADFDEHMPASKSTFSQLLLVDSPDDDGHLHVHTFFAATRSWSAPTKCLQTEKVRLTGARTALVHRGMAHWLGIGQETDSQDAGDLYRFSVEVGNGRVSSTKLPMRSSAVPFVFVAQDERLSVACVQKSKIDIWIQQEGDPEAWVCSHVIKIPAILASHPKMWRQRSMGTMFALYGADNNVFTLNLKTGAMEKVMDLSQFPLRDSYYKCMPYKRDLQAFFLRQLRSL